MSKLLSSHEWDIVTLIEEFHMTKGKFPSLATISNKTGHSPVKVSEALNNPLVQTALTNRGIEWNPVADTGKLTAQQIAAIQLILDISDGRSIQAKLKSLGINPTTYYGWKKQPHFMAVYRETAENLYGESLPEVHQSVIREAVNGSYPHQKLMLAVSGRWDDKRTMEEMNVQFVLMKVLEIIQKHVGDPAQLEAIAQEFEGILNPQQVQKALSPSQEQTML